MKNPHVPTLRAAGDHSTFHYTRPRSTVRNQKQRGQTLTTNPPTGFSRPGNYIIRLPGKNAKHFIRSSGKSTQKPVHPNISSQCCSGSNELEVTAKVIRHCEYIQASLRQSDRTGYLTVQVREGC